MFDNKYRKESDGLCPNHVKNVVKIKGIPNDKIDYMLNKLAVKYKSTITDRDEWIIDFDLIIPEPRYKSDCPKRYQVNSKSHVEKDEDRPWFDWYEWHIANWGTKWNAYEGYTIIGKTQLTFVFNTAWCIPIQIYSLLGALCVKSGYSMEVRYADEDYGSNCGTLTYNAKEHDAIMQTEKDLTNPEGFARYIWSKY